MAEEVYNSAKKRKLWEVDEDTLTDAFILAINDNDIETVKFLKENGADIFLVVIMH